MVAVSKIKNSLPLSVPKADQAASMAELQRAFSTFTTMSEQLSDSYQHLEQRVVELSGELASLSEQRLQELNEKEQLAEQLESLLRLMPAAVIVIDNRGRIQQLNPTAHQWFQAAWDDCPSEAKQLIGTPWSLLIRHIFQPKQNDFHEVSLADGRLVSLETRAMDLQGQLILMTDQTETRALQAKVSRQERLSAMGQMVASLAHQIRTPLSAAMLYASNLQQPHLEQDLRVHFASKLESRLHHLEKQVKDMLLFVKGEIPLVNKATAEELVQGLQEAINGLGASASQVSLEKQIANDDTWLACQFDVLVSACMNLVKNALEAGEQSTQVMISVTQESKQLKLRFLDNGPGMTAEELAKVQEPFYTTKSYGTGLGLAVVKATINAHRGRFSMTSDVGKGTLVELILPLSTKRTTA